MKLAEPKVLWDGAARGLCLFGSNFSGFGGKRTKMCVYNVYRI